MTGAQGITKTIEQEDRTDMNFKQLADNIGFGEEDFLELVELFLETGLADLDEMDEALRQKDPRKVMMAAHSLKGAAVNLGFTEIYEVAKVVEKDADAGRINGAEARVADMRNLFEQMAGTLLLSRSRANPQWKL